MMKYAFINSVLAVAMLAGFAHADVFDFDSIDDGAGFNNAIDDIAVSGNFTLTGSGTIQENGSVAFLFQNGGMATTLTGTLKILSNPGDAGQNITINSLAASLDADTTLTGFSAGGTVQEWQISGATTGLQTFTAPTTGSFANPADTIVWNQPNYVQGEFPTNLDFIDFTVDSPSAVDVFDFNSIDDGLGFNGLIDDISVSGNYSLTGAGFIQENGSVSFLFESGGVSTQLTGTMNVLSNPGDVAQDFTINGLASKLNADTTLTGFSAGGTVQEWQISGSTANLVQTFSAPTTGSFANPIDTIVWDQPNYVQGTFPTNLDFIEFTVGSTGTVILGDVDLSGTVDFLDIGPFITVLSGGTFQAEADCDMSGTVDFLDIGPFIAILSGP